VSCPQAWTISMSWSTVAWFAWTTLINDGEVYCSWSYLTYSLKLTFNTWTTDIVQAEWWPYITSLTTWVWDFVFWDADTTLIDFSASAYLSGDWYDDDFDSDNYMATSTWNTSTWTYYLDSYQDDDVSWRKTIFWYVALDFWYKKVFWNNSRTVAIIDENTNNNDNLNIKIWDVDSWVLHFDIDKPYFIKLVMFNKNKYIATNELVSLWTLDWSGLAWIWYLQNNAWVLSLSGWITWNEYVFDFLNNDYALFIKNNWTGALLYQVTWETTTGTWIYITPIDDSDSEIVRYIWNEILLDTDSRFVAKQTELIYKK
jgi:hypothetical protein